MLLLLALSSTVHTQVSNEIRIIKFDAACGTEDQINVLINQYGERPLLQMVSERDTSAGEIQSLTIIFANPKTRSYTIVERMTDNVFCVTGTGIGISPYTGSEIIPEDKQTEKRKHRDAVL